MISRLQIKLLLAVLAVGLTAVFWLPLWRGGGFVGGDVYSYYLPQKVFYAQRLQEGEFPLWNNHAGFGYPLVAESQTGVFYPLHLLFYSLLEVNAAYNVNHLLHYALAFVFAALYARSIGLSRPAGVLASLVYAYSWFPPRSCWEWAIICGAWLPAALWCAECFLQTRHWRYGIGLSVVLAVQMLAGHFNIAFITHMALVVYVALRLSVGAGDLPRPTIAHRRRTFLMLAAAMSLGFALAAIQLLPSWEFKQQSQRAQAGPHHKPAHGSVPVGYWSQMFLPWEWYSPHVDRDRILERMSAPLGAKTNQVEAHLYFGLIPLGLAVLGLVTAFRSRDAKLLLWLLIGGAALFYTSGWLVPLAEHVPGFGFFQGPGRFGVATTLAVALLAARGLEQIWAGQSNAAGVIAAALLPASLLSSHWLASDARAAYEPSGRASPLTLAGFPLDGGATLVLLTCGVAVAVLLLLLMAAETFCRRSTGARWAVLRGGIEFLGGCLLAASVLDLWIVGRLVTYSPMVGDPPIAHLSESPIRRLLNDEPAVPRLFAPGANLPTVLGVGSVPAYLTFGPKEYVDPKLMMPSGDLPAQVTWLQRASVTHVLSFEQLPQSQWPVELVWQGFDPVLNPAWGRFREPLYLYRLRGSRARVGWADQDPRRNTQITEYGANRIVIEVQNDSAGLLVLTDLMSRGWRAAVDGEATKPTRFEGMFRAVAVPAGARCVVWTYHPASLYWGLAVSVAAILLLAAVAHVRYWHPHRLRLFDEETN